MEQVVCVPNVFWVPKVIMHPMVYWFIFSWRTCLWSSLSIRLCPAFKPQHRCYSLIKQKLTVAAL